MKQLLALAILCSFFTACLNDSEAKELDNIEGNTYKITINNLPENGELVLQSSCEDIINQPLDSINNNSINNFESFTYPYSDNQNECKAFFIEYKEGSGYDFTSASKLFNIPLGKDTTLDFHSFDLIPHGKDNDSTFISESDSSQSIYTLEGINRDLQLPEFNTFEINIVTYLFSTNELGLKTYSRQTSSFPFKDIAEQSYLEKTSDIQFSKTLSSTYVSFSFKKLSIDNQIVLITPNKGFSDFSFIELDIAEPVSIYNDSTRKLLKHTFPIKLTRILNGDTTHHINGDFPFFSNEFGYCGGHHKQGASILAVSELSWASEFPILEGIRIKDKLLPSYETCEGSTTDERGGTIHFSFPTIFLAQLTHPNFND